MLLGTVNLKITKGKWFSNHVVLLCKDIVRKKSFYSGKVSKRNSIDIEENYWCFWRKILLMLKRNPGNVDEKFWSCWKELLSGWQCRCWREIPVMLERNPGDVREKSWWCWRKILAMLKRNPGDVTGPILENSWTVGALIGNLLTWKIFFLPLYFFTLVHALPNP